MSVLDITTYEPLPDDNFFFDTNVWISVFEPTGNARQRAQSAYSSFLSKIFLAKSKIHISSMVISEYINVLLRMDFNLWKDKEGKQHLDFKKDYRKTKRSKDKSAMITTTLKTKILPQCTRLNDNFNKIKINDLLKNLLDSDFNDLYIIEMARNDNLKIVSDDKDFYSYCNLPVFSLPVK